MNTTPPRTITRAIHQHSLAVTRPATQTPEQHQTPVHRTSAFVYTAGSRERRCLSHCEGLLHVLTGARIYTKGPIPRFESSGGCAGTFSCTECFYICYSCLFNQARCRLMLERGAGTRARRTDGSPQRSHRALSPLTGPTTWSWR